MNFLTTASIASDLYSEVRIDAASDKVLINENSLAVNPLDLQIIAKMLTVSPQSGMVSVCGPIAEKALRYAVGMGVKRLWRIDREPEDACVAAGCVAGFLKENPADVVLCGEASWDYATGEFPKYLSEFSGMGLVKNVTDFSIDEDGVSLLVTCRTETAQETLRVKTPVILCCTKDIFPQNAVPIPSMREMMEAIRTPLHTLRAEGKSSAKKEFYNYRYIPPRPPIKYLASDDAKGIARLLLQADRPSVRADDCPQETAIFSGRIIARVKGEASPEGRGPEAEVFSREKMPPHPDLQTARLILGGGMGISDRAWKLIDDIALLTKAATACTRPVYQAGRRPYFEHVGQTGKKVAPRLYVAIGISGALQHIAGVVRSQQILAINTDPGAEIFKYADYGVVADAETVLGGVKDFLEKM